MTDVLLRFLRFAQENWGAILSLGRTIRRGIIRIINKDKLLPGFRVEDEVVILEGVPPVIVDLVGMIGTASKTQVPNHIAVTVIINRGKVDQQLRTEAIEPKYLQRIIRKA